MMKYSNYFKIQQDRQKKIECQKKLYFEPKHLMIEKSVKLDLGNSSMKDKVLDRVLMDYFHQGELLVEQKKILEMTKKHQDNGNSKNQELSALLANFQHRHLRLQMKDLEEGSTDNAKEACTQKDDVSAFKENNVWKKTQNRVINFAKKCSPARMVLKFMMKDPHYKKEQSIRAIDYLVQMNPEGEDDEQASYDKRKNVEDKIMRKCFFFYSNQNDVLTSDRFQEVNQDNFLALIQVLIGSLNSKQNSTSLSQSTIESCSSQELPPSHIQIEDKNQELMVNKFLQNKIRSQSIVVQKQVTPNRSSDDEKNKRKVSKDVRNKSEDSKRQIQIPKKVPQEANKTQQYILENKNEKTLTIMKHPSTTNMQVTDKPKDIETNCNQDTEINVAKQIDITVKNIDCVPGELCLKYVNEIFVKITKDKKKPVLNYYEFLEAMQKVSVRFYQNNLGKMSFMQPHKLFEKFFLEVILPKEKNFQDREEIDIISFRKNIHINKLVGLFEEQLRELFLFTGSMWNQTSLGISQIYIDFNEFFEIIQKLEFFPTRISKNTIRYLYYYSLISEDGLDFQGFCNCLHLIGLAIVRSPLNHTQYTPQELHSLTLSFKEIQYTLYKLSKEQSLNPHNQNFIQDISLFYIHSSYMDLLNINTKISRLRDTNQKNQQILLQP